jgi:hypothetical protein
LPSREEPKAIRSDADAGDGEGVEIAVSAPTGVGVSRRDPCELPPTPHADDKVARAAKREAASRILRLPCDWVLPEPCFERCNPALVLTFG